LRQPWHASPCHSSAGQRELRRQHLAELEALDGSGWERTGRHGEHGVMSVELYETHVAAEEVDHLAQIARLW
jgi:hypothetical protein